MTPLNTRRTLALACLCSLPIALPALADDEVVREYSYDLSGIEAIEIKASVGSLRIVQSTASEIRLVLEIEGNDRGWFAGNKDVSNVELISEVRDGGLILEQTEDDTNTEWTIQLPVVARTSIEMGVGEISAELGATALSVEMGVGDIDITAPESAVGRIDLSVDVGDASLRGANSQQADRKFISQDVTGNGGGMHDMRVELRVGDINVTLVDE